MHSSEREALIGGLAGQCILRKMQKDRSPMPLANCNNKNSNQTGETNRIRTWSTQSCLPNVRTRPWWVIGDSLRWILVFAQSIYTLKLEIAHSKPENLRGDKTVYITTHQHLIKYLDVVWGVANCNTTKTNAFLAFDQQFRLPNFD